MAVRVVVGEDHPLVREGIVHVLEQAGFEVVGIARDAPDLIRKTNAHKPDVVVTDIQMPPDGTDDGRPRRGPPRVDARRNRTRRLAKSAFSRLRSRVASVPLRIRPADR